MLKRNTFRHRRDRTALAQEIFETASFGEATADHVAIRALHAGSFSVASSNRLNEWWGSLA
jgi:hypothetical protein